MAAFQHPQNDPWWGNNYQSVMQVFQGYDTDQSGTLDMNELYQLLPQMGITMTLQQLQAAMQQVDQDQSGHLTFDEFWNMLRNMAPQQGQQVQVQQNNTSVQTNRVQVQPMSTAAPAKDEPEKKRCLSPENNKKLVTCTLVVGIIVGIITLGLACAAFAQIDTYANEFAEIVSTWEALPYVELSMNANGTTEPTCPNGMELLSGLDFQGTLDACNCGSGSNYTSTTSGCSSDAPSDCIAAFGLPPQPLGIFPGFFPALCGRRGGVSAINRPRFVDGDCQEEGWVVCGSDDSNEFCWPAGEECPITDFIISDDVATYSPQADGQFGAYFGGFQLFYKRGGSFSISQGDSARTRASEWDPLPNEGFPIVNIQATQGAPCHLSDGFGRSGRSGEYAAQESSFLAAQEAVLGFDYWDTGFVVASKETGCTGSDYATKDIRWVAAYERSELNIYTESVGGDPDYSHYIPNGALSLFVSYETEVHWFTGRGECTVTLNSAASADSDMKKLQSAQLGYMILSIFSFIIVGLVGACLMIKWIGKDDDGTIKKGEENYENARNLKILKWVFKIGLYICMIVSVITAYALLKTFNQVVSVGDDGLASTDCTDDLTAESFVTLHELLSGLSKKDLAAGMMNFADAADDIVHELFSFFLC